MKTSSCGLSGGLLKRNQQERKLYHLSLGNKMKQPKLIKNDFQRSTALPQPSLGFNLTPYYQERNLGAGRRWIGKGLTLGIDYEFFVSKRFSFLPGISYSRKWYEYTGHDVDNAKQQDLSAYLLARFRFTNPDRKLVFFLEPSVMYSRQFRKYEGQSDWNSLGVLDVGLGIGAEYKLNDRITLNAVVSPYWTSEFGFSVEAKLGVRLRF
ncbi:MAG: outer membrane beta-barrel protein [Flammeovirgaceae bacterium]